MNGVIDMEWWRLAAAYAFVLVLLAIVKAKGIPREKEIVIATVRMSVQLVIVGYLLEYVFAHEHPLYTVIIVAVMLAFAIYTVQKRAKSPLSSRMKRLLALAMAAGFLVSFVYFIAVVLGLAPWYKPSYVIPIAGMIIGNSMTGLAIGVNTLVGEMHARKHMVEAALMLGATPKAACRDIVNHAFDAAMLPTITSMLGMGVVFLPGMMTGQILGGASPVVSIEYQIAIMLGMIGSVSISVILFVQFGYRTFFNRRSQLDV